ncbi:unnamed protein product [Kluyveromyces dobzhanskii CBS 2104]|uniref:WGS project CCBQ000000000 data, contig 00058 n=1 Tax=Kluyveromyces dobzhanskii CBS 2104 TaxID=1427455 RepID=A0A0A8LBM0_9SACH|nr:unnamed protein product [Kluyveromyces dobzhanskii CBS 2104]
MASNRSAQRIELLKHLLRVCDGEQWLFNSFQLSIPQMRQYNMKCEVVQFSPEKLKTIYDMNNLAGSDKVNEKLLYQLNERLKILFTKTGRSRTTLDQHILTAALIDLLITICGTITKSETRMISMALVDSIEKLIDTSFIKPYCQGLLNFTKESSSIP